VNLCHVGAMLVFHITVFKSASDTWKQVKMANFLRVSSADGSYLWQWVSTVRIYGSDFWL